MFYNISGSILTRGNMRKFIFTFFVFYISVGLSFAEITAPEWKEVAPAMYSNIDTEKNYKLPIKQYWQERKIKFEKSVLSCHEQFNSEELEKCYESIVVLEKSKNKMRETFLIENSRSILK